MRRAESRCEKALFYRLFTSAGDRRAGSRGADVSGPFLYPTTLRDGIDTVFRVKRNLHQKRRPSGEYHMLGPVVYA
jgi:hypothetical protein